MAKQFVKVPTHIVRNEDVHVSNVEFVLYVRLCYLYFINNSKDKNVIELDHKKLMRFCRINDTRTFKSKLNNIYKLGLITNDIKKLPTKGSLKIEFNDGIYNSEYFTMMNVSVFTYFMNEQIDEYGFRQLFYYKSHINRKSGNLFCYVGYETLMNRLKISSKKVKWGNDQLLECKLIKVDKHKLKKYDDMYDENDNELVYKFSNHYFLNNTLF